jgi:hypothetical protein
MDFISIFNQTFCGICHCGVYYSAAATATQYQQIFTILKFYFAAAEILTDRITYHHTMRRRTNRFRIR